MRRLYDHTRPQSLRQKEESYEFIGSGRNPRGGRNNTNMMPKQAALPGPHAVSAVHYPADYGFIPDTLAEDGDPRCLGLVGEATFPGATSRLNRWACSMWDEKGPDQKILCVPITSPVELVKGLSVLPTYCGKLPTFSKSTKT